MGFIRDFFADGPTGNTPITAATLNNLEQGTADDDITNPASASAISLATQFAAVVQKAALDSTVAGYVGAASATQTAVVTNFGNHVMIVGAGIDRTGATDSTAAIQAIINANPGRRCLLPTGVYQFTALTLSKGQHLAGAGQQDWRDRTSVFGSAGFLVNANYTGTVMRSTLTTTAAAITIVDGETNSGGISDLTLIGPGSGTSIGILWGGTTWTVVNALSRSVKVANFAVGVRLNLVNEGSFYDLMIRGCTLGLDLAYQARQNAFYTLDVQWCGDGVHISADSYANAFYSTIGQSNTGTAFTISGTKNALYNPYWENNTSGALKILSGGMANIISAPLQNGASDTITINAGANDNIVEAFGWQAGAALMTNAGARTYLQGNLAGLTDNGTQTIIVDAGRAGTSKAPWLAYTPTVTGITIGNGVVSGRYCLNGKIVTGSVTFTVGTTTTMVGTATFTLPVANGTAVGGQPVDVTLTLPGTGYFNAMGVILNAGTIQVGSIAASGALTAFTATSPFTWASGCAIQIIFVYEAA